MILFSVTSAKLKKHRFGASSEKIEREIEQLELALESLETARAAADATPEPDAAEARWDAGSGGNLEQSPQEWASVRTAPQ